MRRPSSRAAILLLAVAVFFYVALFDFLSIARYNTFHASTFDLGIMTQVIWNSSQGRLFETSIGRATNTALVGNYLGNHVRPVLLLLAPLYCLWPDPRLLLILQSVALGVATLLLYRIAYLMTEDAKAALVVACCYLAYPALGFLNLVDFHPVAFSIPLVFLAYLALLERRLMLFWAAVLLALFAKEEMVIPLGIWGLVNLTRRDRRRVGMGLLALTVAWAVLCFGLIIPAFNEGQPYRFWGLWLRLPGLSELIARGGGVQSVGSGSLETIALFLVHLILPLGFLPLVGPTALIVALPSLLYLLLGKRPAFHSVGYQYPAVLIPWLFLAVVEGLQWLRHSRRRWGGRRLYRLGLAFMVIGTVGIQIPLNPVFLYAQAGKFRPEPHRDQVVEALAQIPPDAGVATISQFGPQLANRRILVPLEYPAPFRLDHVLEADYVLLDLVDCRLVPASNPRSEYANIVEQVLQTGAYRVAYWSDRILLLERGTPSEKETAAIRAYMASLVEQDRPCWP